MLHQMGEAWRERQNLRKWLDVELFFVYSAHFVVELLFLGSKRSNSRKGLLASPSPAILPADHSLNGEVAEWSKAEDC